jgi:hypothetical protein
VAKIQAVVVGGVQHLWEKVPNKAAKQCLRSPFMGEIGATEIKLSTGTIQMGLLSVLIGHYSYELRL